MKHLKALFLVLIIFFTFCEKNKKTEINTETIKIDVELKERLENILLKDQRIREIVNANLSDEKEIELLSKLNLNKTDIEGNKKFDLMHEIDSLNLLEIEKIVKKYGYPSKSLVGKSASINKRVST